MLIGNNLSTFFYTVLETDQLNNILVGFTSCLLVSNQVLICDGKKNALISEVILLPTDVHLLINITARHTKLEEVKKNFPSVINCTTFQLKITMS